MQRNNSSRIDILDFIRFLSASSVVLYHYLYRGWKNNGLSDVSFESYDGFLKYGYLGVQVFFVISGFVVYLSVRNRDKKKFFVSRFSRLYPTFWLCLTITLLFSFFLDDGRFFIGYYYSALNYLMFSKILGVPFVDGAYWTLIYELVFYFWVFVFLFFKRDYLLEALTIFCGLSLVGLLLGVEEKIMALWCGSFVGYFLVGALFFKVYNDDFSLLHRFYLFVGLLLCFVQSYFQVEKKNLSVGPDLDYYVVFWVLVLIFVFFYFLARGLFNSLNLRVFWHFGVITYPCYLLHQNIGYIILNKFSVFVSPWVLVGIIVSVLLVVSYIIGRYFEPVAIRWSKHLWGKFL